MTSTTGVVGAIPMIPLADITPSGINRAISTAQVAEMAESLKKEGQLQPIVIRPNPIKGGSKYQIVFGEVRFRAARLLKQETIQALVRNYSDEEAQAVQIVENLARTNPSPLDEARSYKLLRNLLGKSPTLAELAGRVVKPEAYVAQRLRLLDLIAAGQDKLDKNVISLGHALLIAPLAEDQQAQVLKWLLAGQEEQCTGWQDRIKSLHSVEATKRYIQSSFMLALDKAPFDIKDATLSKLGACTACPHNTANAGNLFPDIKGAVCTLPSCFFEKRRKTIDRTVEAAEKEHGGKLYRLGLGNSQYNDGASKIAVDGYLAQYSHGDGARLIKKGDECKSTKAAILVFRAEGVDSQVKAKVGDIGAICADTKCQKHHAGDSGSGTSSRAPLKGMAFVSHKEGNLKKSRGERVRWLVYKALCEAILKGDAPEGGRFGDRLMIVTGLAASHLYHDNARDAVKALGLVQRQKKGGYGQVDWDEKLKEYFPKDKPWAYLMGVMAADDIRADHERAKGKADLYGGVDLYSKRYNGGPHKLFWLARHYKVDVAAIQKQVETADKTQVATMTANVKKRESKPKPKRTKRLGERGTCMYCSCTMTKPCYPPCAWVNVAHTVCSNPKCVAKAAADGVIKKVKPAKAS